MSRKLTDIDIAKKQFKDRGFTLLEEKIPTTTYRLKFICDIGHESLISYYQFSKGGGCKKCASIRMRKDRSCSFDFVKEKFKEKNCILLSTEYINQGSLLEYICHCGKQNKTSFIGFLKYDRCRHCSYNHRKAHNYRYDKDKQKEEQLFSSRNASYVYRVLNRTSNHRDFYDIEQLGYTHDQLMMRLKSCQNWATISKSKWTVDHIYPVSAFLKYNIKDLKIINSLDNLQPLSNQDNTRKLDKYNHSEFIAWLSTKGINIKETQNENL